MYDDASTTKQYYFAPAQNSIGTYWNPYTLVPTTGNVPNPRYSEATDPCTKVTTHGGNWILASDADRITLSNLTNSTSTNSVNSDGIQLSGFSGVFIGTASVPTIYTEIDNYFFVNRSGYVQGSSAPVMNVGRYWTKTTESSPGVYPTNSYRFFNVQASPTKSITSGTGTSTNSNLHYSIRCVKRS